MGLLGMSSGSGAKDARNAALRFQETLQNLQASTSLKDFLTREGQGNLSEWFAPAYLSNLKGFPAAKTEAQLLGVSPSMGGAGLAPSSGASLTGGTPVRSTAVGKGGEPGLSPSTSVGGVNVVGPRTTPDPRTSGQYLNIGGQYVNKDQYNTLMEKKWNSLTPDQQWQAVNDMKVGSFTLSGVTPAGMTWGQQYDWLKQNPQALVSAANNFVKNVQKEETPDFMTQIMSGLPGLVAGGMLGAALGTVGRVISGGLSAAGGLGGGSGNVPTLQTPSPAVATTAFSPTSFLPSSSGAPAAGMAALAALRALRRGGGGRTSTLLGNNSGDALGG